MTKQEFIDYIKSLTVLELADLVHAVEEEFGVSAAATAVAVTGPAAAAEPVEEKTEFDVILKGFGVEKRVEWPLQGEFNARNAAMAIVGASLVAGFENPLAINTDCLANFHGVKRRQEVILDTPKVVAVEDFGHHPTAIEMTISSLRAKYPDRKIWACFEPRSNTAKRNVLQAQFARALDTADKAFIGAADTSKVAERMRVDTAQMAASDPSKIRSFATNAELLAELESQVRNSSDRLLCVFFSNGSFDNIHKTFAKDFA